MISFASLSMIPFLVFTFLNANDLGLYLSAYTILYLAMRLILNPKMRLNIDLIGIILLVLFVYYISERVISILAIHV